jgi:hypothetical protein
VAPQFQVRHVAAFGSVTPLVHMLLSQTLPVALVSLARGSGEAPA